MMFREEKKKIGLLGCIATGIGAIIGSGIFGSLPAVINSIGAGVIPALIAATVYIIACMVPNMFATSVIPASGSFFLFPTKLIHPFAGLFMAIQNLLQPVLISVFAVLFADYFVVLFPQFAEKQEFVSVILLMVYGVAAWFGNRVIVSVNTVMVGILLSAISVYIVFGLPAVDFNQVILKDIFPAGMKLASFSAAVGILSSSLSGAGAVSQIADDIENPRRNIPLTLILAPVAVCIIYIFMAIVTLGLMESMEINTLSDVAKIFLNSGLVTFFIIGGPLFGVMTSIVPVILLSIAQIEVAADHGVFPEFLSRRNRYGVSGWILLIVMAFAMIVSATGTGFGVLMTVFSFANTLSNLIIAAVPYYLYKKYPAACRHAGLPMSKIIVYSLSLIAFITSGYLAFAMLISLNQLVWLLISGAVVITIIYFLLRIRYLKQQGRDIMRELKTPYLEWENREIECKEKL